MFAFLLLIVAQVSDNPNDILPDRAVPIQIHPTEPPKPIPDDWLEWRPIVVKTVSFTPTVSSGNFSSRGGLNGFFQRRAQRVSERRAARKD